MSNPLSQSANQFAVELFQCYLSRHGSKYRNLLLCPYLIYHSLAMMLVGAKGSTAEQLLKVLHIPADSTSMMANGVKKSPSSSSSSGGGGGRLTSAKSSGSSSGSRSSRLDQAPPTNGSKLIGRRKELSCRALVKSGRELTPDGPDEARHRLFLMLTEQVLHGNHDFVHLASFIYLDKGTKRTERYKAVLRDYYETKPKKIDFDNVDLMVKTINEDVARTTENIYQDILSKHEAQKLEKSYMLLVNAVFFRGFWLSNFTEVRRAPFIRYPSVIDSSNQNLSSIGQQQQQPIQYSVNMMGKLDYLPVVSDDQLEARIVKMPFEASDLQMLLILPNNQHSDSTYLCNRITATKIDAIIEAFKKAKNRTVKISMPIFCIDSGKISIQSTLVTMGAGDLFNKSKANMSGVCENKPVWLHKILHRCFIICDNRGSITSSSFEKARKRQAQFEAGLSTSGRSGLEEFVADHPFMYIIFDSVTKTILLIGLYTDPSETLEVVHENQLSPEEAHQLYTEGVYKT